MKASVRWVVAALALSVATIVAVSQTAAPGHWRRGGMSREPMFGMFARHLDLTSKQRTQIHQILAKEKPAMQPLIEQVAQTRHQIAQLALNGPFDESQVRPLAAQQAQTMQDLIVQRARIESELIQVLTSDQKTKLSQLLASRQQKRVNPPASTPSQAAPNP
jgi:Spy/CpxP family protein refolding chaperone